MKVLRIGGKNLASLAGEFVVDFESEPLSSAGLFAISGPTGAGKSTLLDALCLALYDATPRLLKVTRAGSLLPDVGDETVSALDPRTLLRRGAAEAWAEVDFVGNDNQRYRARWGVRRARGKAGGALQKSTMTLHQLPEMHPLGGTKTEVAAEIAQRIGLSFEQFTRAVLLAQNEFSAFLKTDENERGELLETLTGSAIYTELSKRAFERYKAEQEALRVLNAQLASQAPLAPEARAAVDCERALADEALATIDIRKALLEQRLRWHEELGKLRRNEAQADEALAAASAQAAAADARRRQLARLEAVQPARALAADVARLDSERAAAQAAKERGEQALVHALEAQRAAAEALAGATAKLAAAEAAQRDAAPMLDQAKALDAALAALAPAHTQARSAREAARAEAAQARAALQAKTAQLSTAREAQQAAAAWLSAHAHHETLATQWPRWDKLFAQAEQALAADSQAQAAMAAAERATQEAAAQDAQAATAFATAAAKVSELDSARLVAIEALGAFDADALRAERQALDDRRERLSEADKTWNALAATRSRLDEACEQMAQQKRTGDAARAALARAEGESAGLAAAATQAERSLAAAELACADNVEDLRAALADDTPCPVCGSETHPYRLRDPRLHDMLAGLRGEVARCRALAQDNAATQAAQRTAAGAAGERVAGLERERAALAATLAALDTAWQANPLSQDAPPDAERGEWFVARHAALKMAAAALDANERQARQAALARDAAQQAYDQALAAQGQRQQQAQAARTALARHDAERAALAARREAAAASLASVLAELDGVCGDGWRRTWQDDPARYRAARGAEAGAWNQQQALATRHAAAALALEAETAAGAARAEQADRIAAVAEAEFARIDAQAARQQRDRAQLWNGQAVREVEQALASAVGQAREALAARQAAAAEAAQGETRVRAALAQAAERIATLRDAFAAAQARLEAWLADYPNRHPDLDAVDSGTLAELLALDTAWLAEERAALAALDAKAATAATIRAERRAQRELHEQSAAQDDAQPAAEVAAQLDALLAERSRVHETAAALRLQAAQDDARRAQSQAVLAEIDRQRAIEQRWGRLSELIGSSDGKKFRNYAQQFTLDVLLGYANRHLAQLARRYRLERVVHAAGPSLALMVRDQDMGGEVRSVNSLSGGESFLVSLALALGLASLSSNRVRVESLFIDEGFGSLDSETLGVAMDALDALQSLGRKVGVISHVQEMTERIATRVMVRPAGGGSSAISVA